jgi:putative aldouronate transport system permease protein
MNHTLAKQKRTIMASIQDFLHRAKKDIIKNKYIYLMILPVMVYYIVFMYIPMGGQIIAFQDFKPAKGIWGSKWVGLDNFIDFFKSPFAFRVIKNTIVISVTEILIGFPAPIILALMLNEVRNKVYKSFTQTVSYLPHFVSLVVTCGMVVTFVSSKGVITNILGAFGITEQNLLSNQNFYVPIYVISGVWKNIGWG